MPQRRFAPRRGLTYLEVLIAAALGLMGTLGAIALFPIAALHLQRGISADVSNALGSAAIHQADSVGLTDPRRWMFWDTGSSNYLLVEYAADPAIETGNTADDPFYKARPENGYRYRFFRDQNTNNQIDINETIHPFESFCIDPRLLAEVTTFTNREPHLFPYFEQSGTMNGARMRRLSLRSDGGVRALTVANTSPTKMTVAQARLTTKLADDLIFERTTDRTKPAQQQWISSGANNGRRDYMGDFEWIATLSPKINGIINNNTIPNVLSGDYNLSLVVFNRPRTGLDTILVNRPGDNFVEAERLVAVNFLGSGVGGGDVQIGTYSRTPQGGGADQHFSSDTFVRENDWVMLGGLLTQEVGGNQTVLGPYFQWYRIAGVQSDPEGSGPYTRYVSLQGPDWPLKNTSLAAGVAQTYVIGAQMTIPSNVIGVFERTVRLKSNDE